MPFVARVTLHDLYDMRFSLTALGVGAFDPQLMLIDGKGRILACNNNSAGKAGVNVFLPTATAGNSLNVAYIEYSFFAEEQERNEPMDFEVIISSADGLSGEFVLLFEGNAIWDATDVDSFTIYHSEAQAAGNVPLTLYVFNPLRPQVNLQPLLTVTAPDILGLQCSLSNYSPYCTPESLPLDGFSLTLDDTRAYTLTGQDPMIPIIPARPAVYSVSVQALDALTWGDYIFAVHSGVAYPPSLP
jgi:hypothetical protein